MKHILPLLFILFNTLFLTIASYGQRITINGPAGSGSFGLSVCVLKNGNYVIGDPSYDDGPIQNVGAVYLYNGETHTLISTLKGSNTNDQVGFPIVALTNGNFVVGSPGWKNGSNSGAGAATWVNGDTGLNGVVSISNSLVGSSLDDQVGYDILALTNGNYIVRSVSWKNGSSANAGAGAVTWGNGKTGIAGTVSSSNSLIGSNLGDGVGYSCTVLDNGNYVVISPNWNSGSNTLAGAVTWCDGTSGLTGAVSSSNSLIGSSSGERLGLAGIVNLKNGNYVVQSPDWSNGSNKSAGAVIWCDGTAGRTGVISSLNAIVGTAANDKIGSAGILALSNGNYVILSPDWDNGGIKDAGAATWGDGTTGSTGTVSSSNSLVGSSTSDNVGLVRSAALTNGNYVVTSLWTDGAKGRVGAATWCDGTKATSGTINPGNSLVGSSAGDLNSCSCLALSNGNYVVLSSAWKNGTAAYTGAATFCDGLTGKSGTIDSSNSLIGKAANDRVGESGTALTNGNYVVLSPRWSNGSFPVGAATFCNGNSGRAGFVDTSNSLVGSNQDDAVGTNAIALTNGNYIVQSPYWKNGFAISAGAATWCSGTATTKGIVSSSNSMVGSSPKDYIGIGGVALPNGNCVLQNQGWDNGIALDAGAITWMDGNSITAGVVDKTNSLVGTVYNDWLGILVFPLPYDNYHILSQSLVVNNGGYKTAYTPANGKAPIVGVIDSCNSATGVSGVLQCVYNPVYNYLIGEFHTQNKVVIIPATPQHVAFIGQGRDTRTFAEKVTKPFIDSANRLICMLRPTSQIVSPGSITAKVFTEPGSPVFNGETYVRRHYDLSTATIPDTGTAWVTLYFYQADFNAYNASIGSTLDVPVSPADAIGIANLKVSQQRGVSFNGMPGSYSGWSGSGPANIVIDPADSNIYWNACESRWEVSFEMKGYGGLFVMASNNKVPLSTSTGVSYNSELIISPVPASDVLRINCSSAKLLRQMARVTDVYGRTVREFHLDSNQEIDVSQWVAGTYYLRVGEGVWKVVKR